MSLRIHQEDFLAAMVAVLLPVSFLGMTAGPAMGSIPENFGELYTESEGDARSDRPSISADGRFVAFESEATNLVPGDGNSAHDVFVRDRLTGVTERVSVSSTGTEAIGDQYFYSVSASISADGRFVAFDSSATNLVPGDGNNAHDVFVRDRLTGVTERVSVSSTGTEAIGDPYDYSGSASISADGRFVAFESDATNLVPGDTNKARDIFVRDRLTGVTERVSVSSTGTEAIG
ncbi:MAG: PD40 domain-containing protein, partial [Acidobacteria bacterium]|nr:PD40 domain-containing protein [Acidobacteriota bacterium]